MGHLWKWSELEKFLGKKYSCDTVCHTFFSTHPVLLFVDVCLCLLFILVSCSFITRQIYVGELSVSGRQGSCSDCWGFPSPGLELALYFLDLESSLLLEVSFLKGTVSFSRDEKGVSCRTWVGVLLGGELQFQVFKYFLLGKDPLKYLPLRCNGLKPQF